MMGELKEAVYESKQTSKLPEGAIELEKSFRITIEEIENGFILKKSFDIKYQMDERIDYVYYTKKWFSKTNPMKIDEKVLKEKPLADKFE